MTTRDMEIISRENEVSDRTLDKIIAERFLGFRDLRQNRYGSWLGFQREKPVLESVPKMHADFGECWRIFLTEIKPLLKMFSLVYELEFDDWRFTLMTKEGVVYNGVAPAPQLAICHCLVAWVENKGFRLDQELRSEKEETTQHDSDTDSSSSKGRPARKSKSCDKNLPAAP